MERYCELANKTTQQLCKVSTPCIDDHHFKEEEMKYVGELSHESSQIVLKFLLARIGRPDILWSVNKLAQSITKFKRQEETKQNQHQEEFCAFFRSHTFVPINWMCKKQTSVCHSSTETEIISLDAGLRMDGILPLDLWNLVIKCSILHQTKSTTPKIKYRETCRVIPQQTSTPTTKPGFQPSTTILI